MSIEEAIDAIRTKSANIPSDAHIIPKLKPADPEELENDELSNENLIKKFLTPSAQFSNQWLDRLQE